MRDADADLSLLEEAARAGGEVALEFLSSGARHWTKADESPVTEADMAVDALLRERLTAARPDYGWLSEESVDDGSRQERRRVFIVDPIDGTRSFMAREDGWVISVAVVEDTTPIAGVLFNPVRGEMWRATAGGGASVDGKRLQVATREAIEGSRMAGPRSMIALAGLSNREAGITRTYTKSLAYRLAKVAQGQFDAAFATGRSRDWDLAAAILMVQEAGGRVSDLEGRPIVLNSGDTRHPPIVAAGPPMHAAVLEAARRARQTNDETKA